jgi:hypothetical protein
MIQLNPYIAVKTPLGDGDAVLVIDYGHHTNTVWVVRLKGGIIKHFWSDDVLIYGNPMDGDGWDINETR